MLMEPLAQFSLYTNYILLMKLISSLIALAFLGSPGFSQTTFSKGFANKIEVPIAEMTDALGFPILTDRDVDHATVAMNDNRDIVVTYHAQRTDIIGSGSVQQVEFAYFKWDTGPSGEFWEHLETTIVGSIDVNPLNLTIPSDGKTRCVRPDVVAVGNKFCIGWTRVYGHELGTDVEEPAVLECAWIERNTSTDAIAIYTDPVAPVPGLGFILDKHDPGAGKNFFARECRGCVDLVVLNGNTDPTVAFVYPHQTDFSIPPIIDGTRRFTLRVATSSIDSSNVVTGSTPIDLISAIPFDGPVATAGLILPDLAPSPADNAFWLIAEYQNVVDFGGAPREDGSIRLGYWKKDASGAWNALASKTFLTPSGSTPQTRRRPMVSSYPVGAPQDGVSLSFGEVDSHAIAPDDTSANTIYRHWIYDSGSIVPPPSTVFFPNQTDLDSAKGVPLRGRDAGPSTIRRCYADEAQVTGSPPDRIVSIDDLSPGTRLVIDSTPMGGTGSVGRPAASYFYDTVALEDYITVTWEKRPTDLDPLRIWIGVED